MSIRLQNQINQLKSDRDEDRKLIKKLLAGYEKQKIFEGWVRREMHSGMTDLATITVTKILEQGLEATVVEEKTTDEQLRDELSNA